MIKVSKFGGTSMASADALKKVRDIVLGDPKRSFIVVSAAGKLFKDDIKVTDLLYSCYDSIFACKDFSPTFELVANRYKTIVKELQLDMDIERLLKQVKQQITEYPTAPFIASRGEYISAKILAELLQFEFVDAKDLIVFDKQEFDSQATEIQCEKILNGKSKVVIPGFYGANARGEIMTFSRGGSDITGSVIARAVNAELYENFTDVDGFKVADPKVVDNPVTIRELSYKELRELAYMGASVLHSESIFPVANAGIAINIKNTFNPSDAGTMIVPVRCGIDRITGIAGKKNFTIINLEKNMMNNELGFARKLLSILEEHAIPLEHMPSGIDTLGLVFESCFLGGGKLDSVVTAIKNSVNPDKIQILDNIALIATVGSQIKKANDTAGRLFGALAKHDIAIKLIDQGSSQLNIIIGIDNTDYETAIKALYDEFFNQ